MACLTSVASYQCLGMSNANQRAFGSTATYIADVSAYHHRYLAHKAHVTAFTASISPPSAGYACVDA